MKADDRRKARAAFAKFKKFCEQRHIDPPTFQEFVDAVYSLTAYDISQKMIAKTPIGVPYIAPPLRMKPNTVFPSVVRHCSQCRQGVWVTAATVDRADAAEAIICNDCVPEVLGKTMEEIMTEQVRRVTK